MVWKGVAWCVWNLSPGKERNPTLGCRSRGCPKNLRCTSVSKKFCCLWNLGIWLFYDGIPNAEFNGISNIVQCCDTIKYPLHIWDKSIDIDNWGSLHQNNYYSVRPLKHPQLISRKCRVKADLNFIQMRLLLSFKCLFHKIFLSHNSLSHWYNSHSAHIKITSRCCGHKVVDTQYFLCHKPHSFFDNLFQ